MSSVHLSARCPHCCRRLQLEEAVNILLHKQVQVQEKDALVLDEPPGMQLGEDPTEAAVRCEESACSIDPVHRTQGPEASQNLQILFRDITRVQKYQVVRGSGLPKREAQDPGVANILHRSAVEQGGIGTPGEALGSQSLARPRLQPSADRRSMEEGNLTRKRPRNLGDAYGPPAAGARAAVAFGLFLALVPFCLRERRGYCQQLPAAECDVQRPAAVGAERVEESTVRGSLVTEILLGRGQLRADTKSRSTCARPLAPAACPDRPRVGYPRETLLAISLHHSRCAATWAVTCHDTKLGMACTDSADLSGVCLESVSDKAASL